MALSKKIRVFIIDDSLVFDKFLSTELSRADDNIEVVGYAMNASDALRKIPTARPDVITLDVEMPKTNGIEFLKELLPKHLLPVILVSSLNVSVFDALSNGAVDFVKKPDMSKNYSTRLFVQNLVAKIIIASNAKVKLPTTFRGSSVLNKNSGTANPGIRKPVLSTVSGTKLTASGLKLDNTVIAIGASTGGTEATLQVLEQLPANTPGIVVTQHMPEGFTNMYAQRLNRLCKMEVKEARNGDVIKRGLVLIAPGGDNHMKVVKLGGHYTVRLFTGEKVNGHRPSVDVLFRSVAQTIGRSAIGIILTGMGQDGAYGLLDMRKTGSFTIGQDRESCVVYGMPMVAQNIGAVAMQSSCANIPAVLINHLNKS